MAHIVVLGAGLGGTIMAYEMKDKLRAEDTLTVVNLVDRRANLLKATDQVDAMAIDKYSFVRDVYLQKRLSDVWDGNPPEAGGNVDVEPESEGKSKP